MYKFTEDDLYDLDTLFEEYICAGLKQFLNKVVDLQYSDGVFTVPSDFYPENFTELEPHVMACVETQAVEAWFKTIEKMIIAFDREQEPDILEYGFKMSISEKSIDIDNEDEYNRYLKDKEEHDKRKKEGLKLFTKHFHSLWI